MPLFLRLFFDSLAASGAGDDDAALTARYAKHRAALVTFEIDVRFLVSLLVLVELDGVCGLAFDP